MMKIALLGVLACLAISQVEARNPGIRILESLYPDERIIQGSPAAENQFPHQVNVEMVAAAGGRGRCGGTLISPRWVLTAAHCLVGIASVNVRLGSIHFNTPQLLVESRKFEYHNNYNGGSLNNDIGVIDLGRDVPLSDSIKPIRLPTKSQATESFADKISTVSGWGATSNTGSVTPSLNFVDLKVITNEQCIEDYSPTYIIESTICAVGIKSGAQGSCFGDSGGPMILKESDGVNTLIGVVSFVSGAGCDADYASGFARTSSFLGWIQEKTGIPIRP